KLLRAIDFIEAEGTAQLTLNATGIGVSLGARYAVSPEWALGLSYRSRTRLAFSGQADFSVPPELRGATPDQTVKTEMTLPDRIALGAEWQASDQITAAADLELVLWSTIDRLSFDFGSGVTPAQSDPRLWHPTLTPRLGASWRFLPRFTARGGAFVDA